MLPVNTAISEKTEDAGERSPDIVRIYYHMEGCSSQFKTSAI